jgi:hypothetical protein
VMAERHGVTTRSAENHLTAAIARYEDHLGRQTLNNKQHLREIIESTADIVLTSSATSVFKIRAFAGFECAIVYPARRLEHIRIVEIAFRVLRRPNSSARNTCYISHFNLADVVFRWARVRPKAILDAEYETVSIEKPPDHSLRYTIYKTIKFGP